MKQSRPQGKAFRFCSPLYIELKLIVGSLSDQKQTRLDHAIQQ